jgi:hypothetical protein
MRMFTQAVFRQRSNQTKGKSFYFNWIEHLPTDYFKTQCRLTQMNRCKCAFSTSVESECLLNVKTRFQFSSLVVWLSHSIDQCKHASSDGCRSMVAGWNALLGWCCWGCGWEGGWVVMVEWLNTPASCSGGPGFNSQPGDLLSWLRCFYSFPQSLQANARMA